MGSLLELVKPFEGVLDPDLLQSITCGIEDFMHHSIIQTEKVSSETKNSSSQEDQKLTDEEFVNYIPSEEEAKALLEKISQLQKEGTKEKRKVKWKEQEKRSDGGKDNKMKKR